MDIEVTTIYSLFDYDTAERIEVGDWIEELEYREDGQMKKMYSVNVLDIDDDKITVSPDIDQEEITIAIADIAGWKMED